MEKFWLHGVSDMLHRSIYFLFMGVLKADIFCPDGSKASLTLPQPPELLWEATPGKLVS